MSKALVALAELPFPRGPHLAEGVYELQPDLAALDGTLAGMSTDFDRYSDEKLSAVRSSIVELEERARQMAGDGIDQPEWEPFLKYVTAMRAVADNLGIAVSRV